MKVMIITLTNSKTTRLAITGITRVAHAIIGTGQIEALAVGSAKIELGHFQALVDISTESIRFEGKAFRADAISKTGACENAFLILRALID